MTTKLSFAALSIGLMSAIPAFASEPAECRSVRIADGGWTDNAAQNGFATTVLEGLGYDPTVSFLSLGVLLEGMSNGELDVFLANWSPNSDATLKPYIDAGAVKNVGTNLTEARYALAVPAYTYEAGLRDFADIQTFHSELGGKIYALEAGNDSNNVLVEMQEKRAFEFDRFTLVESSEAGMLAAVDRAVRANSPIVFVGWSPHPMNNRFDMRYLSGGDDYFGPDYGSATVWTGLRPGYIENCPNATRFFSQLQFAPDALGDVMDAIITEGADPATAARQWLQENPDILEEWLSGVQSVSGESGVDAVRSSLER